MWKRSSIWEFLDSANTMHTGPASLSASCAENAYPIVAVFFYIYFSLSLVPLSVSTLTSFAHKMPLCVCGEMLLGYKTHTHMHARMPFHLIRRTHCVPRTYLILIHSDCIIYTCTNMRHVYNWMVYFDSNPNIRLYFFLRNGASTQQTRCQTENWANFRTENCVRACFFGRRFVGVNMKWGRDAN